MAHATLSDMTYEKCSQNYYLMLNLWKVSKKGIENFFMSLNNIGNEDLQYQHMLITGN